MFQSNTPFNIFWGSVNLFEWIVMSFSTDATFAEIGKDKSLVLK